VDRLGEWLMQTEEFRRWRTGGECWGGNAVLFAMELLGSTKHLLGNELVEIRRKKRISANKPRCQFPGGGQVVRSS